MSAVASVCTDFTVFGRAVEKRFNELSKNELYVTDIGDAIYDTYLAAFPEGTNPIMKQRPLYDCNTCKQFLRRLWPHRTRNIQSKLAFTNSGMCSTSMATQQIRELITERFCKLWPYHSKQNLERIYQNEGVTNLRRKLNHLPVVKLGRFNVHLNYGAIILSYEHHPLVTVEFDAVEPILNAQQLIKDPTILDRLIGRFEPNRSMLTTFCGSADHPGQTSCYLRNRSKLHSIEVCPFLQVVLNILDPHLSNCHIQVVMPDMTVKGRQPMIILRPFSHLRYGGQLQIWSGPTDYLWQICYYNYTKHSRMSTIPFSDPGTEQRLEDLWNLTTMYWELSDSEIRTGKSHASVDIE